MRRNRDLLTVVGVVSVLWLGCGEEGSVEARREADVGLQAQPIELPPNLPPVPDECVFVRTDGREGSLIEVKHLDAEGRLEYTSLTCVGD